HPSPASARARVLLSCPQGRNRAWTADVAWPSRMITNIGKITGFRGGRPGPFTDGNEMSVDTSQAKLRDRIHDELIDSVDEELELEIDDHRLNALLEDSGETSHGMDRRKYF